MATAPDKELLLSAKNLFQSAKYEEAFTTLSKWKGDSGKVDPKVLHNMSVASYYAVGCTEPKKIARRPVKSKEKD